MKKITVRLYKRHDMDLIALYKNKNFSFQKAMKYALRAYIKNQPYFFFPPASEDLTGKRLRSTYRFFLYLDEKEDEDLIRLITEDVSSGCRNAFVKSVLRGSMVGASVYACFNDDAERQRYEIMSAVVRQMFDNLSEPPTRAQRAKPETEKIQTKSAKKPKKQKAEKTDSAAKEASINKEKPQKAATAEAQAEPPAKEQASPNNEPAMPFPSVSYSAVEAEENEQTLTSAPSLPEEQDDDFDIFALANDMMKNFT